MRSVNTGVLVRDKARMKRLYTGIHGGDQPSLRLKDLADAPPFEPGLEINVFLRLFVLG
jgi:hypothetical protein